MHSPLPYHMTVRHDEHVEIYNHQLVMKLISDGYYTAEGEPIRCIECECTFIENVNHDTMGYIVMSYTAQCKNCKKNLNYWDTGNWMPLM